MFTAGRVHDLDRQTKAEADQLESLVRSGQLPDILPVPAGSTLLVQVLAPNGTVLAAGPAASSVVPLAAASRRGACQKRRKTLASRSVGGPTMNSPAALISQPEKYWDRLFAPAGHVAIVTSTDRDGRINAASYATCVRIVHNPVQIAFTTSLAGHTRENILATGQFVVNLPSFDR